ncbi:muts domain V-domain-containing protein [Crassisporium funariophilum]|nr:muts domain V-domain-containing protein [Crassisporium funariophilum]
MQSNKGATQPTISAFFSQASTPRKSGLQRKRADSPIDLTVDSEDAESPIKRPRLASHQPSSSTQSKATTSVADDWRFSPEKPKQATTSKLKTALEKERHEAFKKKLLQDNSRFLKKEPDILEHQDDVEDGDFATHGDTSGDESDDRFNQLRGMFSNKSKGKSKANITVPVKRSKKPVELGPSGQSYTPLERQILQLKKDNVGTVLMVEVGYKYRVFGDDAKIAAKELGMVAFNDRNFMVASIPTHRRDVHLKKLLAQGYRVGIVNQVETAALKKIGDNRNAPFERKLTHQYTSATYVDDLDSVDDLERYSPPPFMCLIEENKGSNAVDVSIGMITICPSTGDVVWDDFEDSAMRIELETRLVHTRPTELLVPESGLTQSTEKMLSHFTGISTSGHRTRTEKIRAVMSYTDAFAKVSEFYTDKRKHGAASESKLMASVTDFPKRVVIALAHAIKYLSAFGIADAFLETNFFTKFATRAHMLLAANTLTNLEIYRNGDDNSAKGSLMWILDQTKTKFGARLLRHWVGRPLVDKRVLEDRVDAVEEILTSTSEVLLTLRTILKGLPDLSRGLCRIQYGQCTPQEISVLLPAFNKVATAFEGVNTPASVGLKSSVLNDIISSFPTLKEPVAELLGMINLRKASEGKKDSMWTDLEKYPEIIDADMALQVIEVELLDELKAVRKLLKMPSLQWVSVLNDECIVEVKRSENRPIPDTWTLHSKQFVLVLFIDISSRTKNFARYQPPSVRAKLEERAQHRETMEAESTKAFKSFLADISQNYYAVLRNAVQKLAAADCLLSFAQVALQENYVRPEFTDDDALEIVNGRHPMIEALRSDPYVPNSIQLGNGAARSKVITGPNMGGKSSCVRMIALIALMAQIGSYVPADSLKMGLLDSILTRMGASDDLARGRSTFMVEMSETSEILHTATKKSLVILDELGRGTSTFDGMAIADATLQYLVQTTQCKTLFITHYPLVASKLQKRFPDDVQNLHMGYDADFRIDGSRSITFLYQLTTGMASESFGIECGRLAKIPETILLLASERSAQMQEEVQERVRKNKYATSFTNLTFMLITPQATESCSFA